MALALSLSAPVVHRLYALTLSSMISQASESLRMRSSALTREKAIQTNLEALFMLYTILSDGLPMIFIFY